MVEMRALDPLHDEYIFTVSDRASGKSAVFELVDRLGVATRRKLGIAEGTAGAPVPRVASITTANPRAWDLLSQARQAIDKGEYGRLKDLVAEALKEDPEFALAHVLAAELAVDRDQGAPEQEAEARAHLDAAERFVERLPEKERLMLRALRAQVDGDWNEARRVLVELAEAYPLDKVALYQAGDILIRTGRPDLAIGYLERAVALDPSSAPVADTFVGCRGRFRPGGPARRDAPEARQRGNPARRRVQGPPRRGAGAGSPGEVPGGEPASRGGRQGRMAQLALRALPRVEGARCGGRGVDAIGPREEPGYLEARLGRPPRREHESLVQPRAPGACRRSPPGDRRRRVPGASDDVEGLPHPTFSSSTSTRPWDRRTRCRHWRRPCSGYPDADSPGNALIGLSILAETGRLLEASRLAAEARQRLGARWEASREGGRGGVPLAIPSGPST